MIPPNIPVYATQKIIKLKSFWITLTFSYEDNTIGLTPYTYSVPSYPYKIIKTAERKLPLVGYVLKINLLTKECKERRRYLQDVWVNCHCTYSSAQVYRKHLLLTDCRKSSFFLSKKVLDAILSSNLMKKNDESKCKTTWPNQNCQRLCCFSRQIFNLRENESRNSLIFFHYRSSGVMYILSDFDQNLCQQTLQNGRKLPNRCIYHGPLAQIIGGGGGGSRLPHVFLPPSWNGLSYEAETFWL